MTIKEVENRTGLARSHIRFYEKENLISPVRDGKNGYRDYSEQDVKTIQNIAFLRTLGISLDTVRKISLHELSLPDVLEDQCAVLDTQIQEAENAKALCEALLSDHECSFEALDAEKYIGEAPEYWRRHQPLLQKDMLGFVHWWGSRRVWALLFSLSLIAACVSFPFLPDLIPVQWSGTEAVRWSSRLCIFAYPLACLVIRFALTSLIGRWLRKYVPESKTIPNYLANFLCFVALSLAVFTICYVFGLCRHVSVVVIGDTLLFIGLLLCAYWQKEPALSGRDRL